MTDYTKLIERLEDAAEEWAGYVEMDTAPETLPKSMAPHIAALQSAIEALQAENEQMKVSRKLLEDAFDNQADKLIKAIAERDALQAKLDAAPKALEPEPLIKFRHGCKWCGKAKCAAGCYGITKGTPT